MPQKSGGQGGAATDSESRAKHIIARLFAPSEKTNWNYVFKQSGYLATKWALNDIKELILSFVRSDLGFLKVQ